MHTRHITICIKGTNKSLPRVDSSFSFLLYYRNDVKSLSPTKAVKICAMNVQSVQLKYEKPPVHCLPIPPTPYPTPSSLEQR